MANPDEPTRLTRPSDGSVVLHTKRLVNSKGFRYHQKIKVGEIMTDSLNLIHRYLLDETQPLTDRAEVASKFAVKAIPEAHMNVDVKVEMTVEERKEMLANLKLALMSNPALLEDIGTTIGESVEPKRAS